jgi:hypothetical protein
MPPMQQMQTMQTMQQQQRPVVAQPQQIPVHVPTMGSPMAWVPPQQAAMPLYVPQNYPSPGMQVPSYLTAPEPMDHGVVPVLINSCLRAALKGAFHTAANILDHIPWGVQSAPPQK